MRRGAITLVCVAALAAAARGADGQDTAGPRESGVRLLSVASPALLTPNPVIRDALDRILDRSPLFRSGLAKAAELGRHVLVLTTDQVTMTDGRGGDAERFDDSELAESIPVDEPDSVVRTVVVVLNLELVERVAHDLSMSGPDLADDIDRILIHEVYAHAVPLLLAGRAGRCGDPEPGQPAIESCSIRRENEVRAEAGLGTRTDYGIESLNLGRLLGR